MYVDGRSLPDGFVVRAEIRIIGAGAAGITLAREFIGQPFQVALIESGGFTFDLATRELYRGINAGRDYIPLHQARLRYFGGTTNHWGGNCLPISPLNFELRPWIPFSGWPVTRTQLIPFYRRAHDVNGLHNLYIAGSSVFPTGGSANLTLTIVALSLKLADHLKAKFRT